MITRNELIALRMVKRESALTELMPKSFEKLVNKGLVTAEWKYAKTYCYTITDEGRAVLKAIG